MSRVYSSVMAATPYQGPQQPRIATYASYLPELIVEKIISAEQEEQQASRGWITCAVMFADISGFTALTERLAAQGSAGAEQLTDALNAYFPD